MKVASLITMSHDEVERIIPYKMICETREGSRWCGNKLKERYESAFTDEERIEANGLFAIAHKWYLKSGVPEEVTMKGKTLALWIKLGEFCATV